METYRTIDLWTEPFDNYYDCFSGAFVDGFENGNIPFDSYKVIRNCNCIIKTNIPALNITNKHNAIVFYKDGVPVRLLVANRATDVDKCIEVALSQQYNNHVLSNVFEMLGINRIDVDLKQRPLYNQSNQEKEMWISSCDRPELLKSMLKGSYTQSDTGYGTNNSEEDYSFYSNVYIQYELFTGDERFVIQQQCAFINDSKTCIIPLQDKSSLNIEEIRDEFFTSESDAWRR